MPASLSALTAMTYFSINTNSIRNSITTALSTLSRLVVLDIGNNQLTGSILGAAVSTLSSVQYVVG